MANRSRRHAAEARANQFADLLADGRTLPEIREAMDMTNGAAQGMMGRIRKGLGWQAS